MNWLKKQWHVLTSWLLTAILGAGLVVLNNGQKVTVQPYAGIHLVGQNFCAVYANNGQQIAMKKGQRLIHIAVITDSGRVIQAFADTLDATTDLGILAKFTQCKR